VISQRDKDLFENLFILEIANNHCGKVDRGLKIIRDFATVVRYNNVKAAIKLQFRDVDNFIHPNFKGDQNSRYIIKFNSCSPGICIWVINNITRNKYP